MKSTLIVIGIIILALAAGAGGYIIMSQQDNKDTTEVARDNPADTSSGEEKLKDVNLDTFLIDIKRDIPTITDSYVYTESQDPNENLGKAGFYTAGANFCDSRTNVNVTENDINGAFGADCGGAVEVYGTESDATKRIEYFKQFEGNAMLSPGASKQIQNVVLRASSELPASDQANLLEIMSTHIEAQL